MAPPARTGGNSRHETHKGHVILRFDQVIHIVLQIGFHVGLIIINPFSFRIGIKLRIAAAVDGFPDVCSIFLQMLFAFYFFASSLLLRK